MLNFGESDVPGAEHVAVEAHHALHVAHAQYDVVNGAKVEGDRERLLRIGSIARRAARRQRRLRMAMVIVGLLKDAHQARGLIRALDDAGFSGDDMDMQGGLLAELALRGVPEDEAATFAEGVRLGGALVCVRADDQQEASEAANLIAPSTARSTSTPAAPAGAAVSSCSPIRRPSTMPGPWANIRPGPGGSTAMRATAGPSGASLPRPTPA